MRHRPPPRLQHARPSADTIQWLDPAALATLTAADTTAHRIFSADRAWIERFGTTALISTQTPAEADPLLAELDAWLARTGLAIHRVYARTLVRQPRENDQPVLRRGDPTQPPRELVRENGLCYEVDFASGYSVGLFCDQRENRLHLRSLAPRRVLNTFAYTCAFSVAAAHAGAETLSIDLSKSSLSRGRHNFELNDLDPAAHRFFADDVLSALPRLAARGERFDAILLDPPTFGRSSPKRAFRAERDFEDLIAAALPCAAPQASLLLSTNCSSLNTFKLRSMASRVTRGKATFFQPPSQPDIPPAHAASTLWMLLK